MGPRPTSAAAAAAVPPMRGVPQYKYAPTVRNPQQHMNTQSQVTMQQVSICVNGFSPLSLNGQKINLVYMYLYLSLLCMCKDRSH